MVLPVQVLPSLGFAAGAICGGRSELAETNGEGPAMNDMEEDSPNKRMPMAEVVGKHRESIMRMPGVVGVAAGLCPDRTEKCLLVYTKGKKWPKGLAEEIEGYRVEVVDAGKGFRPRS